MISSEYKNEDMDQKLWEFFPLKIKYEKAEWTDLERQPVLNIFILVQSSEQDNKNHQIYLNYSKTFYKKIFSQK